MPVYEYRCLSCDYEFDLNVKYDDRDNNQECAMCGKAESRREYRTFPGLTKASYIDNSDTKRRRDLTDLKTAANLEVEAASMKKDTKEYKKIKQEIHERKKL